MSSFCMCRVDPMRISVRMWGLIHNHGWKGLPLPSRQGFLCSICLFVACLGGLSRCCRPSCGVISQCMFLLVFSLGFFFCFSISACGLRQSSSEKESCLSVWAVSFVSVLINFKNWFVFSSRTLLNVHFYILHSFAARFQRVVGGLYWLYCLVYPTSELVLSLHGLG